MTTLQQLELECKLSLRPTREIENKFIPVPMSQVAELHVEVQAPAK